jgi:ABC-2 type transport system permease protein
MRNVLVIAWYDVKRVVRNRESVFWLFVGPIIFTVFFGILFKPSTVTPPHLAIVNADATGEVASAAAAWLTRDGVVVSRVAKVTPGDWTLVVPAGASEALKAGKGAAYTFHTGAEESTAERSMRIRILKAITRLYVGVPATGATDGPLVVTEGDLGVKRREQTSGIQRRVPADHVMFVFLNLLVSGAGIAEDRASGRLRRMATTPASRREIVLGKLLGRFAIGWLQIVYMLGFGLLVGIQWAEHGWTFLAFLSLFALAAASLGILMGTLFKDPDKCAGMAVWISIILAPLGGLWWPIEIVGPVMRQISHMVPTGWAMEGVNAMLAFGAGPLEVAPYAAGFLALFAVSFPLAARRLRF